MITETITTTTLRDGSEVTFSYRENDQILKPGCRCDAVRAFIDGKQVGYLKFDYTTKALLSAECPTLWAWANDYSGFCGGRSVGKPYGDQTVDELFGLLYSVKSYLRYVQLPEGTTPRQRDIWEHMGDSQHSEMKASISELDRAPMVALLTKLEKSKAAKAIYGAAKTKYLRHHSKPFVAFSNTEDNLHARHDADLIMTNNQGRGLGSLLYRATSQWIAERGLAKGLYASGNRSDSALSLWGVFEHRGWVTKDSGRMYLDPAKFPPL